MQLRTDFQSLPSEVQVEEVGKQYLFLLIHLPRTSKHFAALFSKQHKQALNFLRQLLSHAALGEWEAAENIWKLFPDLLTCRGTVYHPNPEWISFDIMPGRYKYVNHTVWQIALRNEEYEIAEKIGKYMSEEEKQNQFKEIFPDGKIIKHYWNSKEAKRRLKAAFDAIFNDELINWYNINAMNMTTKAALYTLYSYVMPVFEHQTGLVFDARLYEQALKLYVKKYPGGSTVAHYKFWCIHVEEYLAACLGTAYLRAHAQGIDMPTTFAGCILADNTSYFAFRRPLHSIPGEDFWVDSDGYGNTGCRHGWVSNWALKDDSYARRSFHRLRTRQKEKQAEFICQFSQKSSKRWGCY